MPHTSTVLDGECSPEDKDEEGVTQNHQKKETAISATEREKNGKISRVERRNNRDKIALSTSIRKEHKHLLCHEIRKLLTEAHEGVHMKVKSLSPFSSLSFSEDI